MIQVSHSAEVRDRLVGRPAVERHHRAGTARRPRDLRTEIVDPDRRYFDAVGAAIDCFVRSVWKVTGESAFCAVKQSRKRKESRRRIHMQHRAAKYGPVREKIFPACQNVHKLSTDHPHVFHRPVSPRDLRRCALLLRRRRSGCRGTGAGRAQSATDATLYRVFLRDGIDARSAMASTRASADRIVVSLPLGGSAAAPDLQLLSLPADAVDWEKTDAYAESVRDSARYAEHARTGRFRAVEWRRDHALTDIATDAGSRSEDRDGGRSAAERDALGRRALRISRGRRGADLAALFDRRDRGGTQPRGGKARTSISVSWRTWRSRRRSPLLPLPTLQDSVEQALRAAALAPDATERTGLLRSIQAVLTSVDAHSGVDVRPERPRQRGPDVEERTDRAYTALARDTMRPPIDTRRAGRHRRRAADPSRDARRRSPRPAAAE